MATRIKRAWAALLDRTSGTSLDSPLFLAAVQGWLQTAARAVSIKAARALAPDRGVQLLLAGQFAMLPLRRSVAQALLEAARSDTTPDPERFAALVSHFAWTLAVYADENDCCPRCPGDLEMWSNPAGEIVLCCDFLGCTFDAAESPIQLDHGGLVPATRQQVLTRYPAADLLGGRG